ncbi:alpha/beta hydrolase [Oleiharenicola lentus]|uniref:alpha/beta hydrolase n=1 Tax=Oleiharenicola lentus TaxID=2508720 RepID=UPI003F661F76
MKKPTFTLNSSETGTDYQLYVKTPDERSAPGPWPLLLVLDGDDQFTAVVKAHDALVAAGKISPLLLVGVGYGASYAKPANKRARDYTPVRAHDEPTSGGANNFLRFLTATLWPALTHRYLIQPEHRGITGYSLGALFVLHALFQEKPFFEKHLAGSPSIWWGDAAILDTVTALHAARSPLPANLFFSVGEKDSQSMTRDLDRLETQLAALAFAQLDATARRFPKKNHFNAIGITMETGLEILYGRA